MSDLPKRVGYTVMFLRMTATQMRELADATPEIGRELGHIAEQVQVEADSLAECRFLLHTPKCLSSKPLE